MSDKPQRPLEAGDWVDVFRIESVLGMGGFGITYLATDTSLNCAVALKEYFPQNAWRDAASRSLIPLDSSGGVQSYQLGLERFYKEGQSLALFNHPNIVRVRRLLQANGTAYLVMDYEQGETLESYLQRLGRPLKFAEAEELFLPLMDGLRAVHEQGLLHLDIKPANIFLRSNGIPLLIDFGGARYQLGQVARQVSYLVASDGYAPVEQYSADGQALKATVDIYGLAATLYFAISGRRPADAPVRASALIDAQPDPLRPAAEILFHSGFPQSFLETLDVALSLSAAKRPQSVRELQQQLFTPTPPPSAALSAEPKAKSSFWMLVFSFLGLGVVVLLLGIFWTLYQQGAEQTRAVQLNQRQAAQQQLEQQQAFESEVAEARRLAQEAKQRAEAAEREAQRQAARVAAEQQRQAEMAAEAERQRLLQEQQRLQVAQAVVSREEQEQTTLVETIGRYYAAIADGNAELVRQLWFDPNSNKALKAYKIVQRGGGGVCRPTGPGVHWFNDYFSLARLQIEVSCDERRQNKNQQIYRLIFTLEKNTASAWRIVDLKSN
jgi:serine/threonine protein kinase